MEGLSVKLRTPVYLAAMAALALVGLRDMPPATACSSSTETFAVSLHHPDLPLTPYLQGELGLLQPSYARSHLVVAYRYLAGAPLSADERTALAGFFDQRLPVPNVGAGTGSAAASPSPPQPLPQTPSELWAIERARVAGAQAKASVRSGRAQWRTLPGGKRSYQSWETCLPDAFRVATDTLKDRERTLGAASTELADWIAAQDAVFKNCESVEQRSVPNPLPASASAGARADRAYQIAAAQFYGNQWDDAERSFRAIGQDPASPWNKLARYMAVRVRVRRGTLHEPNMDEAEIKRALAETNMLLQTPDMAPMHEALRRYRGFIRFKAEPRAQLSELQRQIATGGAGTELAQLLTDYTLLLDANEAELKRAPETDTLTAWLGTMQGVRSHDFALKMYASTRGALPWLVATLSTATRADDRRLDPVLAQALSLDATSPAFVTARYHVHRISLARGLDRKTLFESIRHTKGLLRPSVGPSSRNAFALLAARAAPDLQAFLQEAPMVPAGQSEDSGPVVTNPKLLPSLPPELRDMLASELPITAWRDAALSPALAGPVRAHIAATAWARAHLLGDAASAAAVAPIASRLNPNMRPYIDRVEQAKTADERRLGLVYALLKMPTVGPTPNAFYADEAREEGITSSYGDYFWCPDAPPASGSPAAVSHNHLGAASDREVAKRERAMLAARGTGATWLAQEAVRLSALLPQDPRVPEALHLAVRATRFGCKDAATPRASKRAFEVLHQRYPGSSWAKATPYYY
jgi:hypothetical protein